MTFFEAVLLKCLTNPRNMSFFTDINQNPVSDLVKLRSQKKVKNPCTCLEAAGGLQEVEASKFKDIRHMKMIRFSVVRAGRFYPPGNNSDINFC
jgi:hypothetical protein